MVGMEKAAGASVSATVCVTFPPGQFPESLESALAKVGPYGDISRIDLTFGAATGRLLVTYYDVRASAKVLEAYAGIAEEYPPAAHDFRSVSISATTFASMPPNFKGFQSFGDIAGVSMCGTSVVVDFFDGRAAQQVALVVPGSRPVPARSELAPKDASAGLSAPWAQMSRLLETYQPQAHTSRLMVNLKESVETLSRTAHDDLTRAPGFTPEKAKTDVNLAAALASHKVPTHGGSAESSAAKGAANKGVGGAVNVGPGKPPREKVDSKDLTKFDIIPEKVRGGEDTRTTVMVRNVPKSCSREAFLEQLSNFGLDTRFTFFYMPFDKRRNIHCGFAFVNFKTPSDVLTMLEGMKASDLTVNIIGVPLAVSYALLQGQDQLMKHFSLSAVMYDNDARKRPVFMEWTKN